MKRIRSIVSVILVTVLLYGIMGGSLYGAFAAETPVNITVDMFKDGTLSFYWSQLTGTQAAVISYHTPDDNDVGVPNTTVLVQTSNTASISGLEADYIYDISVLLYGAVDSDGNPSGNVIGKGLLFYLPSITFYSTAVAQEYNSILGGGREIGANPKLKLRWKIPRVYYSGSDADNGEFITANRTIALTYMQDMLNGVYDDGRELSTFNYKINISTDLNLLNSGSDLSALLISQESEDSYTAGISSGTATAAVTAPDPYGFISFELWGRADDASTVQTTTNTNVLPDDEIYPGTVYYMNIKPIFKNSAGTNVNAITVGNPLDQNGSMLAGNVSYTYTPIRFQLTKDSADNIYVKIYKINQGSLDLPRLYYEVQATDDSSIPGDWSVKKTLDDSYFSGETAITVLTGVNPNNEVYYKIVVKSDSASDRLESLGLPYTLTVDTSRPPLPTGITLVDRALDVAEVTLPSSSVQISVKSTDVTLSWDKPLNWDDIKDDLYFHFLLSTNQVASTTDVPLYIDGTYWDSYPAKYRLVKYVSAASPNITEVGNTLTYTIKAFDLFTWEDSTGNSTGNAITNDESYPTFLLPNTVYYLQMYTTNAVNKGTTDADNMSDKSIIASFTTLNGVELDVPLPVNFSLSTNGKDTSVSPAINYVDLLLDKISVIDWNNYTDDYDASKYKYNIYYDFYMNSRTDTNFTLIGSTENQEADLIFTGVDDPASTSIKAHISTFSESASVALFGYTLLPNTTYYFKVKTRLVITSLTDTTDVTSKSSIATAILPVTTIRLTVNSPDDNLRKPLAPTDFAIAVDSDGNRLLTESSVTFTWTQQEDDVLYQMIRTAQKVSPTDLPASYSSDPEYLSFLAEYDTLSDGVDNDYVYLDATPLSGTIIHSGKFTYNSTTKICTYTVDRRLFPNKVYYFSLKSVRVDLNREPIPVESVWVSIPVTTSLIEAPISLEVVLDAELGFFWTDSTVGFTAEDYKIYAKASSDASYTLMSRSQATIVKDSDAKTYYGRITGLDISASYDVKVIKGINTVVYEKNELETRDGYHELEVRWKGKPVDDYSGYEIAIMAEGATEYTTLSTVDLEQYTDKDGNILPYYTEETAQTASTDYIYCYARINSAEVELPGSITTHQVLLSNVKYHIKVRTVKIDPTDTDFISYSKYIGPVNTRTEFSQDDYDDTDREEKQEAVFMDKLEALEKGYYWRVAISSNTAASILLKADMVADAIKNASGDSFTIDMTSISANISTDEIYVPVSVIKVMNSLNKSLILKTAGAEFQIRPTTLDASSNEQISELLGMNNVQDLYLKMDIDRTLTSSTALPPGYQRVSNISELDIHALGLTKTDSDFKKLFYEKLYNKDTGLVSEKLTLLQNTYVGSGTGSTTLIDKYTQSLIELIEQELSTYIDSALQSAKLNTAIESITVFGAPVSANLSFSSSKGVKLPYVLYDGASAWQKISSGNVEAASSMRFNIIKTGKYVILTAQASIGDVPEGYWAESYITSLSSKYDLGDVFTGINNCFMPENRATSKEVILLYEKVIGKTYENTGLDIKQKALKLGLSDIIKNNALMKDAKKQETAAVLLQLFSVKKGINKASLKPGGRVEIADEAGIEEDYVKPVLMIVDMKVMETDENGKFHPTAQMTRAEVVAAFAKLLQLTGDL